MGVTSRQRGTRRAGFSFVELMIVMVALTLLTALLLPVFSRSVEASRRTRCFANLRQLGISLTLYAQDYNGHAPLRSHGDPATNPTTATWRDDLFPYVKSGAIYQCGSNPAHNTVVSKVETTDLFASYACNYSSSGLGIFGNFDGSASARLPLLEHPSKTIAIAESTSPLPDLNLDDSKMIGRLFAGHNGMTNYLFADGHMKPLRPLDTYYNGGKVRNMWHRDLSPFSM